MCVSYWAWLEALPPPMTTAAPNPLPASTRRWPRHQVQLPILIATNGNFSQATIQGLATEISRGGMALYAGVHLQPGDPMEIEFQTSNRTRIAGVVRNREGYCYGIEFRAILTTGPGDDNPQPRSVLPADSVVESKPRVPGLNGSESNASYKSACGELAAAEDKLAMLLQRRLESNMSQHDPEFKRLCLKMLRIRELRRQMEGMVPPV
jgi:PilZ domain-containing protein